MYGYISPDGVVGQLFQEPPAMGTYHPDFASAIERLPEGVTTGWRRVNGEWLPPVEPEEPGIPELDKLKLRVAELTDAFDMLLGGMEE